MEDWTPIVIAVLGIKVCLWYLIWGQQWISGTKPWVKKLPVAEVLDSRSEYRRIDSLAQAEWEKAFAAATAWDDLARMARDGPLRAIGPGDTFSSQLLYKIYIDKVMNQQKILANNNIIGLKHHPRRIREYQTPGSDSSRNTGVPESPGYRQNGPISFKADPDWFYAD